MINFALFGAGRIGQVHALALNHVEGARLKSVSDISEQAASAVMEISGARFATVADVLIDLEIDAVIIASPTHLHAEQIELVLGAEKHIFCEKPIDLDLGKVKAINELVEASHKKFMLGFNRRFDPSFQSLKQQLDKGAVGAIEQVQITSRDPHPPSIEYVKNSGGIFKDMMIHDFDMARFLLGEEFTHVNAMGSNLVDPKLGECDDIDTAVVSLKSVSGKLVCITNSRRSTYGYDQRVEVHASKGMLLVDNPRHTTLVCANQSGYKQEPLMDFFLDRYKAAYSAELTSFVSALEGKALEFPNSHDGIKALELAEAAHRSLKTNTVIVLNE